MRNAPAVKAGNEPRPPPYPTLRGTPATAIGPAAASGGAWAPDAGGRFEPFFQPRIRLRDGAVTGFEALARWRSRDGTIVAPATFLPRLNEGSARTELLLRMLEAVLVCTADWRRRGVDLPVSLNLEAKQLVQREFTEAVFTFAARFPGALPRLHFELLESGAVENYEETNATIRALRSHGVRFYLDDFGAGFATPLHLKRLAISAVKLDREFVQGVVTSEVDRTVVVSLIAIAKAFGCSVVAEGVESDLILHAVSAVGCDEAQGYAIARPLGSDAVLPWLRTCGRPIDR
jgi:EAL domain-containing protein (putative c-di-GMP-specific phosphodiesterase class I)